jgi:putative addiction module component (TIGR02574 family)
VGRRSTARHTEDMSAAAKELIEAALKLDAHEREQIADAFWDSLDHGDDEASVEKAWEEEIARRCKEIDEGRAELVAWEDVKAEIAQRLDER